jgi:hypothetical protein
MDKDLTNWLTLNDIEINCGSHELRVTKYSPEISPIFESYAMTMKGEEPTNKEVRAVVTNLCNEINMLSYWEIKKLKLISQ